jgi:very-short-patch-repair endonuclease
MRVFSSMRGDEINPAGTTSRGALLLRDFLRFAEFGRLESVVANASSAAESPFEQQVASELVRRGVKVVPQVGVTGYRIDMGVLDDDVPGRFVCGIECDGVAYHSAETARDRDRLRQQVLEARGWTIVRVWSTDWFKDRGGQIERLLQLIGSAKVSAIERAVADAEAEARATELAEVERLETARVDASVRSRAQSVAVAGAYVRPVLPAYRMASVHGRNVGQDFLEAPNSLVVAAIVEIVGVEAPVHVDDLSSRIAGMWGFGRVGSRIAAKIQEALKRASRDGVVVVRGEFVWTPALVQNGAQVPARSRSGTRISGDRVAAEEVREAIVLVLRAARGMSADELLSEARQILGVGRASLAPAFDVALKALVTDQTIGEGSAGFALRG